MNVWDHVEVAKISEDIYLVKCSSGLSLIKRYLPADTYPVFAKLKNIRHINLMNVIDAAINGNVCVVLFEYIEGMTVEEAVEGYGPYTEDSVKKIMSGVCDGLSVLHKNGIIHRDINPSNIMIAKGGTIKIIDYDIVRSYKEGQRTDTHVLGTVGYASPEQFGFTQTGVASDIYSCGALINYMLTGHTPDAGIYEGEKYNRIIGNCIAIDATERYGSADDLKKVITGQRSYKRKKGYALPGFRTSGIKKFFTVLWFILWGLSSYDIIYHIVNYPEYPLSYYFEYHMWNIVIIFFWGIIPYCLFGDILDLVEKAPSDKAKTIRRNLNIAGVISLVVGFILTCI